LWTRKFKLHPSTFFSSAATGARAVRSSSLNVCNLRLARNTVTGGSGGGAAFESGDGRMDFAEFLESIVRIAHLRSKAGALGEPASMDECVRRLIEDHRSVAAAVVVLHR
jgi:hypothetical protein